MASYCQLRATAGAGCLLLFRLNCGFFNFPPILLILADTFLKEEIKTSLDRHDLEAVQACPTQGTFIKLMPRGCRHSMRDNRRLLTGKGT